LGSKVLTVVCWKWNGWRSEYKAAHVNALEVMLKDHLALEHRLVCVTDDPAGVKCETLPIWREPAVRLPNGKMNCYRRLRMFAPEARELLGERVLSIDLDVVILKDITDLITDDDFRILAGRSAPYNGSLCLHRPGTRPFLWSEFDPKTSPKAAGKRKMNGRPYVGSDQAWISHRAPNEATWGVEDGVYQYVDFESGGPVPDEARIIFFAGKHKPWHNFVLKSHQTLGILYQDYFRRGNEDTSQG
jgi:hypothetical protein